jgi:hypothetical protein
MSCLSCASNYQEKFPAEMIIHFSGLEHLDEPGVWAFPRLLVCLNCGLSQFTVRKSELAVLANGVLTRATPKRLEPAVPGDLIPRFD